MKIAKQTKKPAIPQPQRIKYVLRLVEDSFQRLQDFVRGHRRRPLTEEVLDGHKRFLDQFREDLINLVHLDNRQLYHPYVRVYLLSWPKNKDFLRKLHRGLETGIKRQIKASELPILAAIYDGQEKGYSLHRIQVSLEGRGVIRRMSPHAFYKRAEKLLSLGGPGRFYNPSGLPPRPEHQPAHVQEARDRAAKNLRELRATPEKEKELQEYIEERRKVYSQKFPKQSQT